MYVDRASRRAARRPAASDHAQADRRVEPGVPALHRLVQVGPDQVRQELGEACRSRPPAGLPFEGFAAFDAGTPSLTLPMAPVSLGPRDGDPVRLRLVRRIGDIRRVGSMRLGGLAAGSPPALDGRSGPEPTSGLERSTSGGNRTPNRRFWRPVLYQLSYARSRDEPSPILGLGRARDRVLDIDGRRRRPGLAAADPAGRRSLTSSAIPCAACASARGGSTSSAPAARPRGSPSGSGSSGPRTRCIPARHIRASTRSCAGIAVGSTRPAHRERPGRSPRRSGEGRDPVRRREREPADPGGGPPTGVGSAMLTAGSWSRRRSRRSCRPRGWRTGGSPPWRSACAARRSS